MRIQDSLHYPRTTANHTFSVGMGIVATRQHLHTDANRATCVGTGISDSPQYPHTDANRTACVGIGIPGNPHYSHTTANRTIRVGTEIPTTRHYPHTDAKPRLLGVNGDALTSVRAGFSLIHHRNGVIRITNEALTFTVGGEFLPSQLI